MTFEKNQSRRRTLKARIPAVAAALGVLASGVALGVTLSAKAETAPGAHPLDDYPGFGRSPQAALRDDTIAYWEAFKREQHIASCMQENSFDYTPSVAFPEGAVIEVAHGLGITAAADPMKDPNQTNATYEANLSALDRERYVQALVGETAAELAGADRTGEIPAGRGEDFATGGCFGAAAQDVGSIWTVRRDLEGEYQRLREELDASPEMTATRTAFSACAATAGFAVSDPGELEAALAEGTVSLGQATAVRSACDGIWADGYGRAEAAALKEFIARNEAMLAATKESYSEAPAQLDADEGLRRYLARHLAWIEAQPPTSDEHAHG